MQELTWFFGLIREGGGYRIVASGPTEARVNRELVRYTSPCMVVQRDDLPALGVPEREWRRWLPEERLKREV